MDDLPVPDLGSANRIYAVASSRYLNEEGGQMGDDGAVEQCPKLEK